MNYELGSAVKIVAEIPLAQYGTATMTVDQILDPEGTEVVTEESMSLETVNSSVAKYFYIFQSTSSNNTGRYKFVTKSVISTKSDLKRGYFYLEEL